VKWIKFISNINLFRKTDLRDSSGSSVKAVLVDPNNASITQYNSQGIDDPFTYRARQGFIGIEMWPGNDTGVYLQGHLVIPNPWGDVFTNGTTTTTDTTAKGGGDKEENCDPCDPEILGAGGRRGNKSENTGTGDDETKEEDSGLFNDAWFRNLKGLYNGKGGRQGWKDMTCDQLRSEHDEYMNSWLSMSRLGFGGNYSDYHV